MPGAAVTVRASTADDVATITRIYAHAVDHGTGTFELEAPSHGEMARRRTDVLALGLPWLVAELDGAVVGYAYASQFRPRPAYLYCVEDSIYLDPEARGRGVGTVLLTELVEHCERQGRRQMLALIGDSDNAASIALHERCGFAHCGRFDAAGWKFDRWLDVVLMQRPLGPGATGAQPALIPSQPGGGGASSHS